MTSPNLYLPEMLPADQVYPLAYGNEEETGLMDNHTGEMGEPNQLAGHLENYLPDELMYFEQYGPLFLQNGGKLYQGGAQFQEIATNIERATPECISPSQLALYIRAGEMLLINTVVNYLVRTSESQPGSLVARIQRRVIDGYGNRKGCHDSIGFSRDSPLAEFNRLPPGVLGHLASRSFVTGAGLATSAGNSYAQKVDGLHKVEGYGYFGSMYRITDINGTPRLEIRCNDVNISEWAVRTRIGSSAISLALNQTPLGSQLVGVSESNAIESARRMNVMLINPDGTLMSTPHLIKAVDMQRAQADLALSRLHLYTEELPIELEMIAREVYEYCDDFKKVLNNQASIDLLADRADWAAKFSRIIKRLNSDVGRGVTRTTTDIYSQAHDLQYDYIRIEAEAGQLRKIDFGPGYRLRDRGHFRSKDITDSELKRAYLDPPSETRAALRGKLIRQYFVAECDWDNIVLHDGHKKFQFELKDVLQNEFNIADKQVLMNIKQSRSE